MKRFQNSEKKSYFFQKNQKFWKVIFFAEKEENAIVLVLPFVDISLRPELSSPPHFRIQGG